MDIQKRGSVFEVRSDSGKTYEVDLALNTCTCPHFVHRVRKAGGDCKHIAAAKECCAGSAEDFDDIITYVKDNVFVDSIELIEKYGEDKVEKLISMGELIEEEGKIRLL